MPSFGAYLQNSIAVLVETRKSLGSAKIDETIGLITKDLAADRFVPSLDVLGVEGKSCNIIGYVRPGAVELINERAPTGRPMRLHDQSVLKVYPIQMFKACVKRAAGRRVPWPRLSDLKSRGHLDCTEVQRHLGWRAVTDRAACIARAFDVHGPA